MTERTFRGVGVSPGVAVGRALPWDSRRLQEPARNPIGGADDELARFDAARARTRRRSSR